MDIGIFDFLEGLSPWWWVAGGIALGVIEMATMSFFLIWPGLAALVMAVLVYFAPGLSGEVQVALFAIIAVVLTFLGRGLIARYGDGGAPETTINSRADQLIGRHGLVLGVTGPDARVEVDGIPWPAIVESDDILPGTTVEITDAIGTTLKIRNPRQG